MSSQEWNFNFWCMTWGPTRKCVEIFHTRDPKSTQGENFSISRGVSIWSISKLKLRFWDPNQDRVKNWLEHLKSVTQKTPISTAYPHFLIIWKLVVRRSLIFGERNFSLEKRLDEPLADLHSSYINSTSDWKKKKKAKWFPSQPLKYASSKLRLSYLTFNVPYRPNFSNRSSGFLVHNIPRSLPCIRCTWKQEFDVTDLSLRLVGCVIVSALRGNFSKLFTETGEAIFRGCEMN